MSSVQSSQAQQCWNRACDCFATAKIFEARALKYRKQLNWLSYLGIAVPAIFGAMVAAWGKSALDNKLLMFVVAATGVVQVGMSVLALIHHWSEEHAYSNQSASVNFQLSDEFKLLSPLLNTPTLSLRKDFDRLVAQDQIQTSLDNKKHVTDSEKRRGHRNALWQFQRQCASCGIQPTDMKPTTCTTCGDFK